MPCRARSRRRRTRTRSTSTGTRTPSSGWSASSRCRTSPSPTRPVGCSSSSAPTPPRWTGSGTRSPGSETTQVVSLRAVRTIVLAVGRLRPPYADDVQHYRKLLARYTRLELVEVREDQTVEGRIPDRAFVVLLDSGGREF